MKTRNCWNKWQESFFTSLDISFSFSVEDIWIQLSVYWSSLHHVCLPKASSLCCSFEAAVVNAVLAVTSLTISAAGSGWDYSLNTLFLDALIKRFEMIVLRGGILYPKILFLFFFCIKLCKRWLRVQSRNFSCRRPEFGLPHPVRGWQTPVTPASWDLIVSSGILRFLNSLAHTHTHIYIIKHKN